MPSNERIQIQLDFMANTNQAKAELQNLSNLLQKLQGESALAGVGTAAATELRQASQAATELGFHLKQAINQETGKLDLSKLNMSLMSAGTNLSTLATKMAMAGSTGQEAFTSLAVAISQAEMPVLTLSARMDKLFTTFKNTARWMISSGVINVGLSAVRNAYSYVQDLDKSLNRIQIVTKHSTEEMARFAIQANKSAQALSTTTTKYTDAALIYYQQGLGDKEVQARTDATIKLANVTGQTAETVSSQLTSIWNNFAEGADNLEYFADVITALGATTASSSSEIATALEKFAAVGNAIGLSYEYAASAVATVVAQTRLSAEIVGTAFKTIFARMESLKLGEALEDGVNLGQYSEALEKIGVQILDTSGNLRDMNDILDDAGTKWGQLSRAQQVATAQTVAGIRQYTTFMALMENYDKFRANLMTAENAEGELQAQQEIYEKSWQAAINRVKSAAEDLYSTLVDNEFFKGLNNLFADIIKGFTDVMKAGGGFKMILEAVAAIFLNSIALKVTPMLQNLGLTFDHLTGNIANVYAKTQESFQAMAQEVIMQANLQGTYAEKVVQSSGIIMGARAKAAIAAKNQSQAEQQRTQMSIQLLEILQQEYLNLETKLTKSKTALADAKKEFLENSIIKFEIDDSQVKKLSNDIAKLQIEREKLYQTDEVQSALALGETDSKYLKQLELVDQEIESLKNLKEISNQVRQAFNQDFESVNIKIVEAAEKTGDFNKALKSLSGEDLFKNAIISLNELKEAVQSGKISVEEAKRTLEGLKDSFIKAGVPAKELKEIFSTQWDKISNIGTLTKKIDLLVEKINTGKITTDQFQASLQKMDKPQLEALLQSLKKTKQAEQENKQAIEAVEQALKNFENTANKLNVGHIATYGEMFSRLGSGVMSLATAVNSFKSLWEAFTNPDMSGWERATAIMMSFGMLIPSVLGTMTQLSSALKGLAAKRFALNNLEEFSNFLTKKNIDLQDEEAIKTAAAEFATDKKAGADGVATLAAEAKALATKKAAGAEGLETTSIVANTAATIKNTAMKLLNLAVMHPLITAGIALAAVIAAITINSIQQNSALAKATKRLEEANKALAASKKASEEATQTVNDLKDGWDKLQDLNKQLDELTKGTDEWKQKLIEVNEQTLSLMEKFPQLAQYLTSEGGKLGFSTKGYEEALKLQQEQARNAQAQALANTIEQRNAQLDYQILTQVNEIKYTSSFQLDLDENEKKEIAKLTEDELLKQSITQDAFGNYHAYKGSKAIDTYGIVEGTEIAGINDTTNTEDLLQSLKDMATKGIEIGSDQFWDTLAENTDNTVSALKANETAILKNYSAIQENSLVNKTLTETLLNSKNEGKTGYSNVISAIAASDEEGSKQRKEEAKNRWLNTLGETGKIDYVKSLYGANHIFEVNGENIDIYEKDEHGGKKGEAIAQYTAEQYAEQEAANLSDEQIKEYQKVAEYYRNGLPKELSAEAKERLLSTANWEGRELRGYNPEEAGLTVIEANIFRNASKAAKSRSDRRSDYPKRKSDEALSNTYDKESKKTDADRLAAQKKIDKETTESKIKNLKLEQTAVDNYVESYKNLHKETGLTDEDLELMAKKSLLLSENLNTLSKTVKDNEEVLKNASENSWEYKNAMTEIQKVIKDLVDRDLGYNKVKELWDDETIQKAIDGDIKAIQKLRIEAAKDIAIEMKLDTEDFWEDADLKFNEFFNFIQNWDFSVSPTIDDTIFMNALRNLITQTRMTAADIQKMLGGLGQIQIASVWQNDKGEVKRPRTRDELEQMKKQGYKSTQTVIGFTGFDTKDNYRPTGTGGKGGGEDKTPKKDSDIDKFHEIDRAISNVSNTLSKYEQIRDKAFGKEKLDALDKEIDLQEKLNDEYQEGIDLADIELQRKKNALLKLNGNFDTKTGELTNYQELMQQANAYYNAGSEKKYQEIIDAIQEFEETFDKKKDYENKLREGQNKIRDDKISKINTAFNDQISLQDKTIEQIQFLASTIENVPWTFTARIANTELEGQTLQTKFNLQNKQANELLAAGLTTQAEIDNYNNLLGNMKSTIDFLRSIKNNLNTTLLNQINFYVDKIAYMANRFDFFNGLVDNMRNIVDLVGKDRLQITNKILKDMNEMQMNINKQSVETSKKQLELAKQALIDYRKNMGEQTEETIKTVQELEAQVDEAQKNLMEKLTNSLTAAAEKFTDNLVLAGEEFAKAITGDKTFEELSQLLEKEEELHNLYVEDFERSYEISKLTRQIEKQIDNSANIRAKEKLRDLEEEIRNYAAEREELSQYDLDYMQKLYDLRVAEIALEEAQNAKSKVRLTRDSEGNYGYTYTADENKTDDAIQKYEDAIYNIQKLTTDYIKQITNSFGNLGQEITQALSEIDPSDPRAREKAEQVVKEALKKANYYRSQGTSALNNNNALMRDYANTQVTMQSDILDSFSETVLGQITGLSNLDSFYSLFMNNFGNKYDENSYVGKFFKGLDDIAVYQDNLLQAAGTSVGNFGKDLDDLLNGNGGNLSSNGKSIRQSVNKLSESIQQKIDDFNNPTKGFKSWIKTVTDVYDEIEPILNAMIDKLSKLNSISLQEMKDQLSGGTTNYRYLGKQVVNNYVPSQLDEIKAIANRQGVDMGVAESMYQANKTYGAKYDTGGYTGEWGTDGRLAMLHQKELVLNADDTKNFLSAVDILRDISKVINLQAVAAAGSLGSPMAASILPTDQVIDQHIEINAQFPNATNHNEIEEAFRNLTNVAAQYGMRK